jgi:hypothetical protein
MSELEALRQRVVELEQELAEVAECMQTYIKAEKKQRERAEAAERALGRIQKMQPVAWMVYANGKPTRAVIEGREAAALAENGLSLMPLYRFPIGEDK